MEAPEVWAEEAAEHRLDPGWHTHVTGAGGNDLTIAVAPEVDDQ